MAIIVDVRCLSCMPHGQ